MLTSREALEALLDRVFPRVEPHVQRAPNMRGDDAAVDARDDERSAVEEFIGAILAEPSLEVRVLTLTEMHLAGERTEFQKGQDLAEAERRAVLDAPKDKYGNAVTARGYHASVCTGEHDETGECI